MTGTRAIEYTRGHWETYVANYASGRRRAKIKIVKNLLGEISGTRVLDVGIGAGYWTRHCRDAGATVTTLEYEEALIEPYRTSRDLMLVQGDAQTMPFATESFDSVLLLDVIEHLREAGSCLREISRVLRPGGRLVLVTDNTDFVLQRLLAPLDRALRIGSKAMARIGGRTVPRLHSPPSITHIREYTVSEILDLVRRAGFSTEAYGTFYDGYSYYLLGSLFDRILEMKRRKRLWSHTYLMARKAAAHLASA